MRPRRVTADDRCSLPNERAVLIGEQLVPILAERLSTFMSGESPKREIPKSQRQVQPAQMHVNTLIRAISSLPNETRSGLDSCRPRSPRGRGSLANLYSFMGIADAR